MYCVRSDYQEPIADYVLDNTTDGCIYRTEWFTTIEGAIEAFFKVSYIKEQKLYYLFTSHQEIPSLKGFELLGLVPVECLADTIWALAPVTDYEVQPVSFGTNSADYRILRTIGSSVKT